MATKRKKKSPFKNAIKHPGALTNKKKKGESTAAAAQRIKKSPQASAQAKRQANFYLNVLKPSSKKRKKKGK